MNISLWAPFAKSVELVTAENRIPLGAGDDGDWQLEVDESLLQGGYRYSIDGGDPLPDPRSRWQPDGVHGASHVVDTSIAADALRSAAPGLAPARAMALRDAVIYEMHVGTFTPEGTYTAAQGKLAHLLRLGITHIELMPLATFPGARGWGYDGVDLYAPFPAYGTPQQLAGFVRSCHEHGLRVLLDVVYNHVGPDGNYLGQYGPYFTDRYKTGWGMAINYDGPHSDQVRRFVIDNALMWLRDYGFDGLRLDAVHAIFCFEAVHVLEELGSRVHGLSEELGRTLVLIAESDLNDPRLVRPRLRGGFGLDAQWADDFHHAIHRFFTNEIDGYYADFCGLADLATALRDGYVYQGQYSAHRQRRHGRPPTGIGAQQLVVCAQNHDQIGNRAAGERLSMLVGVAQQKAIAALTLLSPFTAMLFQGEEWGASTPFLYFTDHQDAALGRLVADGRVREFASFRWQGEVPNPQEWDTFARSKLDWSEVAEPHHAELYEWHRRLIELRRSRRRAEVRKPVVKFDAADGWLRVEYGGLLTVLNFAARAQCVPMPRGEWELLLASGAKVHSMAKQPAHGTIVYRRK
ncbi:MAG: malto-oligosyltrehalose trehalohydrolase [Pseudomonadota bacterium]|nr:malto-oligosyltrehalose trehalohydrolase [Pseudomonadota bacterium]